MKSALVLILQVLLLSAAFDAVAQPVRVQGRVLDAETGEPVIGAAVTQGSRWAVTDTLGVFRIEGTAGAGLTITSLGYETLQARLIAGEIYRLRPDSFLLQEVVVTAAENHGLTSASKIGADAISHIQPTSVADLMELLPGGLTQDPILASAQLPNLRAAGGLSSNYTTSALGTRFIVDGQPVDNNANLQYTPAFSNIGSDHVNLGTDMRTLPVEDIESVDIVRGIAPVEHGDLTSGLVRIRRIRGGRDLHLRFKSDLKSQLVYAGKGWEWGGRDKRTFNLSLGYLDSRSDPRNTRQNYKRMTGSIRAGRTWDGGERYRHEINANLDYTGSFDDRKSDQDLDMVDGQPIETCRSSYNRFALGAEYQMSAKQEETVFRGLSLTGSLSYERDLIDRWRQVISSSETPFSTSRIPGEYDAIMIPARYEATLQVDGRPFYAYLQALARFRLGAHNLKAGAEWTADKNFGKGTVFDLERPFSTSMSARPRAYYDIPADNRFSLFAEENVRVPLGAWALEGMAGLRMTVLPGLGSEYALAGKAHWDPRANLRLSLPQWMPGGYKLEAGVYGGIGVHSKYPTMDMLHPDLSYGDRQQLNYWPDEKRLRRINLLVYTIDTTPYALDAARNLKWEVGADARWNGWSFSADYFDEDMTSGFRSDSQYMQLIYKDYDESAIDKSRLSGPPALEDIPFVRDTSLLAYGITSNGSRTRKRGIEYTLTTPRIPVIRTRLTVSGAWFRTEYMNSQPEYERPSAIIDGRPYPYIGIYDKNDGYLREQMNTNFLFDTQVPRLGLIFTSAFQCIWFTGQQTSADDSWPIAYLDKQLARHPFTEVSAADGVLRQMVRQFSSSLLEYRRVPFLMNVNLKLSKKLYHDRASFSVFVNRLFTVAPDYEVDGVLKRRSSTPYFGMECSVKL